MVGVVGVVDDSSTKLSLRSTLVCVVNPFLLRFVFFPLTRSSSSIKGDEVAMPIDLDLKRLDLPDGFFRFLSFRTISSSNESN